MQNSGIYYLFPFGKVSPGSRVLVYGAGQAGQMYMRQILASNYCEIVGVLDQRADWYQQLPCHVWLPDFLLKMGSDEYDYVVISVQNTEIQMEIVTNLCEKWNVPHNKIILPLERYIISTMTISPMKPSELVGMPAFERSNVPIALVFRIGSGLGDAVIALKLMEALLALAPEAIVDIFVEDDIQKHYAEVFYTSINGFGSIQPFEAYAYYRERYVLAINRNRFVDIDYMDEDNILSVCPRLYNAMQEVKMDNKLFFRLDEAVNARNYTLSHILGTDCYSSLGGGALPISDNKVKIHLWPEFKEPFEQLGLKNYITINTGSGGILARKQVKEWPIEYMGEYLRMVKKHFPGLEIVQLGSSEMKPLPQADQHCLGLDLRLVEYILAQSVLHVDIEGGLVHLASQLGTKCAVIFGPTDPKYFGYRDNINLMSTVCVPCFGVRLDAYHCLRGGHERPPCMCAVKPEMVWDHTREWLEKHVEHS